jgi:ribosomal protein L16 Arg81 hydroxylase
VAEVEYQGIRLSGGKLLIILPLLGTIGGGLWAGFEFYKDYMDMKEQIQEYVAPDLSGFDKRLDVFKEKMASVEDSVMKATDYTRDIKNDLKKDVARLEKSVDAAERRTKATADAVRTTLDQNENKVRGMVTKAEDRFDTRREQIRNDMTSLEERLKKQMGDLETKTDDNIRKALENPLSKMK